MGVIRLVKRVRKPPPLTDAGWAICTNPSRMLAALGGRADDQSLRLFAVACCRRIDALILDERSRRAVDVAKRWADGEASEDEFLIAREEAREVAAQALREVFTWFGTGPAAMAVLLSPEYGRHDNAAHAAAWTLSRDMRRPVVGSILREDVDSPPSHDPAAMAYAHDVLAARGRRWLQEGEDWKALLPDLREALKPETRAQCDILRDLFGDHVSPPVVDLGRAWEDWNDGFIPQFAEALYRTENFAELPTLADALEASGCADPAILSHLRRPGPHWPGCWALERLMGPRAPRAPTLCRTSLPEVVRWDPAF